MRERLCSPGMTDAPKPLGSSCTRLEHQEQMLAHDASYAPIMSKIWPDHGPRWLSYLHGPVHRSAHANPSYPISPYLCHMGPQAYAFERILSSYRWMWMRLTDVYRLDGPASGTE
jgi:hypothetical protein